MLALDYVREELSKFLLHYKEKHSYDTNWYFVRIESA